jgi:hypothetical protein
MAVWRCPHCATPQPEASRCWLCGLSTTTCAACRHYRKGIASGLGLCGRNPRVLALHGTEVFPCWEAKPNHDDEPSVREGAGISPRGRDDHAPRTFVPVEELRPRKDEKVTAAVSGSGPTVTRWSLWGDADV